MKNHDLNGECSISTASIEPGKFNHECYPQSFSIPVLYPVYFTNQVFNIANPCLTQAVTRIEPNRRHRIFVVLDSGFIKAQPRIPELLVSYISHNSKFMELAAPPYVVPGGERSKNNRKLPFLLQKEFHRLNIDRQSVVLIVGGGAVLDMGGYAAATTHRGIRVIRFPTTVLSQCDGGLGVKNGINAYGIKNFIGTFAAPFAILNDIQCINTLPRRQQRSGMAEAIKAALIRDSDFFTWLENNAAALSQLEPWTLASLIQRSAEIHLRHIALSGDPFELGSARPLDFGHWSAHKLESLTRYRVPHGEAVAIGIAIDCRYSAILGLLSNEACERIISLLERLKLPYWHPALDLKDNAGRPQILDGLLEFQTHIGGELTISLLRGIGLATEVTLMDETAITDTLSWLKKRHGRRCAPE